MTEANAAVFASTWIRDYAPMTRSWLERTRGAKIDLRGLTRCGRSFYARNSLTTPPQNVPDSYRRVYGPWWLITFCDASGIPSVSVAVSVWATGLAMENGALRFPAISGNEIVAIGIPVGHVGEYPSAPETAISYAARHTGKRVSEIPELITPLPTDGPPQLARWRLELDDATSLRTASGERKTREVFVGPTYVGGKDVAVLVAAPRQPGSVDLHRAPVPEIGENLSAYRARVHPQISKLVRRLDVPIQVEVASTGEGR